MTFRNLLDRAFGATSILFGLILTFFPMAYVLHFRIFTGTDSPWFPVVMTGMAITGLIQLGGGFGKIQGH